MYDCDFLHACLSTESKEESGVSSEDSEHPDKDERSPQSARLWKVCDPATGLKSPNGLTCSWWKHKLSAICLRGFSAHRSARPQWSWSSLASTSLQVARTLTSTWHMTSLLQMMWPRDQHRSHPRRCGLTLWCKFNVAHCGNGFFLFLYTEKISRNTFKCYVKYFIFQAIFVQTRERFMSKQGTFVNVTQQGPFFKQGVHVPQDFIIPQARDEDGAMDPFLRNSFLFRKKTMGSMLDPQRKPGTVCTTQPSPALQVKCFNILL